MGTIGSIISGFNPINAIKYVRRTKEEFGTPLLVTMFSVYFGVVGGTYYVTSSALLPYCQAANLSTEVYTSLSTIALTPWACRGFIGILSDLLPIFGFYKRSYLYIFSIIGIACLISLGAIPYSTVNKAPFLAGLFLFGANLFIATFDLLTGASYFAKMQQKPHIGGNLVSFAWFSTSFGQILPSILVGVFGHYSDVRIIFYIFVILCIPPLAPIYFNGLYGDRVITELNNTRIQMQKLQREANLIFLTAVQAFASLILILLAIYASSLIQMIYVVTVALGISAAAFYFLPKVIARFNLYLFLAVTLYVNISEALNYYFTASSECVPDGHLFSTSFVSIQGEIVATLAEIVAITIFQVVFSGWKFRTIFCLSTIIKIAISITDLTLINGWNRNLGILNAAAFLVGGRTLTQIAYITDIFPTYILIARLSPLDVEAIMYGFLGSTYYLSLNASKFIGVFLMDILNIQTIYDPAKNLVCNYDNFSLVAIISHMILPILTIPLIFVLVPNAYMNENVLPGQKTPISQLGLVERQQQSIPMKSF